MMRIGQMVRYVGSKTFVGDRLVSSTNKHFISVITEFDSEYKNPETGKMENWWCLKDDDNSVYAESSLVPINPDNEAWGDFEEMMSDLRTGETA